MCWEDTPRPLFRTVTLPVNKILKPVTLLPDCQKPFHKKIEKPFVDWVTINDPGGGGVCRLGQSGLSFTGLKRLTRNVEWILEDQGR